MLDVVDLLPHIAAVHDPTLTTAAEAQSHFARLRPAREELARAIDALVPLVASEQAPVEDLARLRVAVQRKARKTVLLAARAAGLPPPDSFDRVRPEQSIPLASPECSPVAPPEIEPDSGDNPDVTRDAGDGLLDEASTSSCVGRVESTSSLLATVALLQNELRRKENAVAEVRAQAALDCRALTKRVAAAEATLAAERSSHAEALAAAKAEAARYKTMAVDLLFSRCHQRVAAGSGVRARGDPDPDRCGR
ncbi:uncharacterized protein AMSG_01759 [Thecamonas trahens ATCC 50062]|uniref:Uncharacterized protein n=1 Tax=Thecamonas trahens ATCC 50062 TaxID=461836 RepID=A0A0L0DT99_THETB|nr:hypothetical protein AMSG_01759 [Thecamonas trahens ATCC 50062]KNC55495.1 hypothetical protein AMSG_01759 [Thecamonas trahens ATCC 50062]|eukprot:XP_013761275.1 hypothetical protein AMSG_01759 [Thecamonas trahens ATCC 50062]